MDSTHESAKPTCSLYAAVGRVVQCQPARCSFWEADTSTCAVERVGLLAGLEDRPELARWLLAVRAELSSGALELPDEPLPPFNLLPLPGFRR